MRHWQKHEITDFLADYLPTARFSPSNLTYLHIGLASRCRIGCFTISGSNQSIKHLCLENSLSTLCSSFIRCDIRQTIWNFFVSILSKRSLSFLMNCTMFGFPYNVCLYKLLNCPFLLSQLSFVFYGYAPVL